MNGYAKKRNLVVACICAWLICFSLQGAGVLGVSPKPLIFGIPSSVCYLLLMGIWGVANAIVSVKLLAPYFYEKAEAVMNQE